MNRLVKKIFLSIFLIISAMCFSSCKKKANNLLDEFYNNSSTYFKYINLPSSYISNNIIGGGIDFLNEYNNSKVYKISYYSIQQENIDIITDYYNKYIQFIKYEEHIYYKYTYNYLDDKLYYETNDVFETEMNTFLFDIVLNEYIEANNSKFSIDELFDLVIDTRDVGLD